MHPSRQHFPIHIAGVVDDHSPRPRAARPLTLRGIAPPLGGARLGARASFRRAGPTPTPRPKITGAKVLTAEQLKDTPHLIPLFDSVRERPEIVDAATAAAPEQPVPALLPRPWPRLTVIPAAFHRDLIGVVNFAAHSRLERLQIVDVAAGRTVSGHAGGARQRIGPGQQRLGAAVLQPPRLQRIVSGRLPHRQHLFRRKPWPLAQADQGSIPAPAWRNRARSSSTGRTMSASRWRSTRAASAAARAASPCRAPISGNCSTSSARAGCCSRRDSALAALTTAQQLHS